MGTSTGGATKLTWVPPIPTSCGLGVSVFSNPRSSCVKPFSPSSGTENERPRLLSCSNSVQSTQSKQEKSHSSQVSWRVGPSGHASIFSSSQSSHSSTKWHGLWLALTCSSTQSSQ